MGISPKVKIRAQLVAQSAGAVEYTDSPNECPGYDTLQSDGEVPVSM